LIDENAFRIQKKRKRSLRNFLKKDEEKERKKSVGIEKT